jgi:hypothetical protein
MRKAIILLGVSGSQFRRPRSVATILWENEKKFFSFLAVDSKERTLKNQISTLPSVCSLRHAQKSQSIRTGRRHIFSKRCHERGEGSRGLYLELDQSIW